MKRRLLNVMTLLSLLLCMAAAALWVRSYWVFDDVQLTPRRGVTYRAAVRPGLIVLSRTVLTGRTTDVFSDDFDRPPGWSAQSRPRAGTGSPFTAEGSRPIIQWAGFDYLARDVSRPRFGTLAFRRIVVPVWLPFLLTAILPVRRGWSWARRRTGHVGDRRCSSCGYDLRATPDRCPECGTAVASEK